MRSRAGFRRIEAVTQSSVCIWIDGAARGNPGPASAAGCVKNDGELLGEWGVPLGVCTNNEAEYLGLILALEWLHHNPYPATIFSDSQLMVEQIAGRWKVKADNLKPLYFRAKALFRELPPVQFQAIPRTQNRVADALANQALDRNETIAPAEFHPIIDQALILLNFK